jgi:hypothetical protein
VLGGIVHDYYRLAAKSMRMRFFHTTGFSQTNAHKSEAPPYGSMEAPLGPKQDMDGLSPNVVYPEKDANSSKGPVTAVIGPLVNVKRMIEKGVWWKNLIRMDFAVSRQWS